MSRKKSAFLNILSTLMSSVVTILLGFAVQKVFIENLGIEILGLNNLFTSIAVLLTFADLGFSAAVSYSLYGPFAAGDKSKIRSIVLFYKKLCLYISIIIMLAGIALLPFLKSLTSDYDGAYNIYFVFLMFIANSVFSYLMTYKRVVLQADQKNFIITFVHALFIIILYLVQIFIILNTHNYYLFIAAIVVSKIFENIVLNIIVGRNYSYILESEASSLDPSIRRNIVNIVKGTALHSGAGHVASVKDSVLITGLFGLTQLGLYANYQMIFLAISTLTSQVFFSITANIGNLLLDSDKVGVYDKFKSILLLNTWIATVVCTVLAVAVPGVIAVWLGDQYTLDGAILIAMTLVLYLQVSRQSLISLQSAAGVAYQNKHIPILESLISVTASIGLGYMFGIGGIIAGTGIAMVYVHIFNYPKYAFELVLSRKKSEYIVIFVRHVLLFLSILTATVLIGGQLSFDNVLLETFIKACVAITISVLVLILVYRNTDAFKYCINLIKIRLIK